MTRLSFDQLTVQVEKLYAQPLTDIDAQCQVIAGMIAACGWDETEYWEEFIRRGGLDNLEPEPYSVERN